MSTGERTLRLLSLLQTHRYWPGADLASRLGVSPRTLRRDVDRLRALGYDIDAARGVAGGYQLRGSATLAPLMLDDAEATAVAVGLRQAATGAATDTDAAVSALAKVTSLLPADLRARVDAVAGQTDVGTWPGPRVESGTLAVMAHACRDHELVRFGYVARDGRTTDRLVEPHRLVNLGRRWYLVAHDGARDDWRSFRLDRMSDARPAGGRFTPRSIPGGDAVAFVEGGIGATASGGRPARVRFGTDAETVASFVGRWGTVEADADDPGACVLTLDAAEPHWVMMVMAAIDAPVTVLEPPDLVDVVRAAGSRLAAA